MTLEAPRFQDGKAMLVAGLGGRFTFENGAQGIPALWMRFGGYFGRVPNQVAGVAYGVCHDFHEDKSFEYVAGVEVTDGGGMPAGFATVQIPARHYAVFSHRSHISTLRTTLTAIWTEWLPASGRKAASAPTFERYGPEFNPMTGTGLVEIWVPLDA